MTCSLHTNFKIGRIRRIRGKFGKQGIPAISSIRERECFKYNFTVFIHHGSNMIIFTNIDTNKQHTEHLNRKISDWETTHLISATTLC